MIDSRREEIAIVHRHAGVSELAAAPTEG